MTKTTLSTKKPATSDLLLLDIKPISFSDEFAKYRDAKGLLYIKGCRRDVLVGSSDALKEIPSFRDGEVSVYKDVDAYAHLLTYVTGLISRTRGESQIVSQFKGAYSELERRAPDAALRLQRLYRNVIQDNGIIRNHVTQNLKPAFYEACAHELSEQQAQDRVLVIANAHKSNKKPDEITENIVRYLGGNRKESAKTIVFTHPDEDTLRNIYSYFLSQKAKGRISSQVAMLRFEEALDSNAELQGIDKAYVCFPMSKTPDIDAKIISEWRQKEVLGGQLIHLGGNTKAMRQSSGFWRSVELFNYTAPEEVTTWQKTRKTQNEQAIARGKIATKICAGIRSENERPSPQRILHNL